LKKVKDQKPESSQALAEIELHRSKSATLSTLHQQLSHHLVQLVKQR